MPVYHCFRGDAESVALEKEGLFSLLDTRNCNWLCYQTDAKEAGDNLDDLTSVLVIQGKASRLGMASKGTEIRMVVANNVDELRIKL